MSHLNDKIKIAFFLWTLEGMSGSERVVYDIVRKLNPGVYSTFILSLRDGLIRATYEKLGAKVLTFSKSRRFDFTFIYKMRKALVNEKVDIINAHHFGPLLWSFLATRCSRIKLVYTEHSRWQLELLKPLEKLLNKMFLAKSDAVIAISRQIEEYYVNSLRLKRKKVHFIANGIDLGLFANKNSHSLRKELRIKPGERIVGMVANIRPEKNHKLMISAFGQVAKRLKNVRLVLVGLDFSGGDVPKFAFESGLADRILFLGQREDIPGLLRTFDVFCLPSLYEGLPLTVLEAMASGVPVIGADVLGINEVITHGVNGMLFSSNDENELAEAILKLLKDNILRNRLSVAGRVFVKKHYCLDDKINQYDRLFRSLCEN